MNHPNLPAVGLAAALVAVLPGARAQDVPPAQRIEITAPEASDTEQRRRDPVAKTIVGREELDRYGDDNVADVIKRLPGVQLRGGAPRMRGLGAGYTLLLVDGERPPPGFSLADLPPSQVERIEVTRGPTAEHGTQAVAGTINVVLRSAARRRQRELRLGAGYTVDRPVANMHTQWADRVGEASVSLPVSLRQWRGGDDYRTERVTRDAAQQPLTLAIRGDARNWGHGLSLGPRIGWQAGEGLTLESQTWAQRNDFRASGTALVDVVDGSTPVSVDDDFVTRGHWQMLRTGLRAVHRGADGVRLEARIGLQGSNSESRTVGRGRDADGVQTVLRVTDNRSREEGLTSNGKYTRALADAHTLAFGWDVEARRRHEVRSVVENGEPQTVGFEGEPFRSRVERGALFVQDEWEFAPRWGAYLGVRAESIATASRSSTDALRSTSGVVTPLLHLAFRPGNGSRDVLRASLTRSFRAPELAALMARPVPNTTYPVDVSNVQSAPDRVGNPDLRPELATGIDVSYEKYLPGGGVMSIGVFHRRIRDLIRNELVFEDVPWATAPRWVLRPVNLEGARSTGVEFELKGQAAEWLPQALAAVAPAGLNVRASASAYRSAVDGIPGPDDRLDGQQPWALNLGFDQRVAGTPLAFGVQLALAPEYTVQQTPSEAVRQAASRRLDAYATWAFGRDAVLRLSVNNALAPDARTRTESTEDSGFVLVNDVRRSVRPAFGMSLTLKL